MLDEDGTSGSSAGNQWYVGREHTVLALKLMALKLMALTFVRTSELIGARWDIPAERIKLKTPHIIALSTQAIGVLKKLKEISL